jgi:hypothetical protein
MKMKRDDAELEKFKEREREWEEADQKRQTMILFRADHASLPNHSIHSIRH